eukprot:m.237365 g.237365  ORF g.237365 m.237365 type:complete len:115 (-) comp54333_c0_seq6:480-824(-)
MSTTPHRALQTEPLFCFQVKVHDPCFLPSLSLQDFCSERLDALVTDVRASTIILPEESEVDDHATTAPVSSTPASPATANRASRIPVAVPARRILIVVNLSYFIFACFQTVFRT